MPVAFDQLPPEVQERVRRANPGQFPPKTEEHPKPTPKPSPRRASPAGGPSRRQAGPIRGRVSGAGARARRSARSGARDVARAATAPATSAGELVITFVGWTLGVIALSLLLRSVGLATKLTGGISTAAARLVDPADPIGNNPFTKRT